MTSKKAVFAHAVPPRAKSSNYPPPFAQKVVGREKRALGDAFGLSNFGVNLTQLEPGAASALHHKHRTQDEFVYVLEGTPTLYIDDEVQALEPGMVVGFPANGAAHHIVNESDAVVVLLEIGDRSPGDTGTYPKDDLKAVQEDGVWRFTHKDGTPY